MSRSIWISGLVPSQGAEVYDGIRLAYGDTETEAYADLNEWLMNETDECSELSQEDPGFIQDVRDKLSEALSVRAWNVEETELSDQKPSISGPV